MRKLVALTILIGALAISTTEAAQQRRYVPSTRVVPQQRIIQQRFNNQIRQGNRIVGVPPGAVRNLGNIGRHGLPMVTGRFGVHEYRNRSAIMRIPGLSDTDAPVDVDVFIDSIDYSSADESVDPCSGPCTVFGAISTSNDGVFAPAWNFPTAEAAQRAALNNCVASATEQCATNWVGGTNWLAGIHCENDAGHWSGSFAGNSLRSAIANAYRFGVRERSFNPNECQLVSVVAADGSQNQLVQKE